MHIFRYLVFCYGALTGAKANRLTGEHVQTDADFNYHVDRPTVRVKAYWIRHGFSCANLLAAQKDAGLGMIASASGFKFTLYRDPALTQCAVDRAQSFGPEIFRKIREDTDIPPLVFSSAMVRAIETALYNLKDIKDVDLDPKYKKVMPIPHIAEHGWTPDNLPLPYAEQKEKKFLGGRNAAQLQSDFGDVTARLQFIPGINPEDDPGFSDKFEKSDYALFLNRFPDIIAKLKLHSLTKDHPALADNVIESGEIPVVIVSHSNFMKKELECEKDKDERRKPRNNEVWVQSYEMVLPTEMESGSMKNTECHELFPSNDNKANFFPYEPSLICPADLTRCAQSKWPTAMVKRDEVACSQIVAAGGSGVCGGDDMVLKQEGS